jgi:hypothetical protein
MSADSELESLGCYPFHLPPEQPKRNTKEEKALRGLAALIGVPPEMVIERLGGVSYPKDSNI